MKRVTILLAVVSFALLAAAPVGAADFGMDEVGVKFEEAKKNTLATKAGTHPYSMTTSLSMNVEVVPDSVEDPETHEIVDGEVPVEQLKDLTVTQIPGFVGDQTAIPQCPTARFFERPEGGVPACPDESAVGIAAVKAEFEVFPVGTNLFLHSPVYNLPPPPGVAARFGFIAIKVPITFDVVISQTPPL